MIKPFNRLQSKSLQTEIYNMIKTHYIVFIGNNKHSKNRNNISIQKTCTGVIEFNYKLSIDGWDSSWSI